MSDAVAIGPLLLPVALLVVLGAVGATLGLGRWLSRDDPRDVDETLWLALLLGVLVARLAFVFEYRALYLDAPLSVFDIRDGGWNAPFGLIAAWLLVLHRARRRTALRRPLFGALALGSAILVVGTTLLALQPGRERPLPDLAFDSLDGRTVRLTEFAGRPTVVNLWATWCPPCVREMPVLQAAQRRHPDVHVVFLNQGENAATVARWLDRQRLTLRNVLIDPRRQAGAEFRQAGYPTTLFFDARGTLVSTRVGELSTATLEQRLQALRR